MEKVNDYDVFEVIDTFNIEKVLNCLTLKNWTQVEGEFTPYEAQFIEQARQKLEIKWDEWNEEELKMNFISLVLFVAQVEVAKSIATFYERKLSGYVNKLVVDCMFASTTNSGLPKMPYFFLQVQNNQCGDSHQRNVAPPEGQMLAAMILAQEINQDNKPIYGSWIQGAI